MKGIIILSIVVVLLASCAISSGVDYAPLAASGEDVLAGKNWNAPRRNNMYDRWEFNTDGTFHFIHVHEGTPLDRGNYRYELKDGKINFIKEGEDYISVYVIEFKGKTFTVTPVPPESGVRRPVGGMGALPEMPVAFTHAK